MRDIGFFIGKIPIILYAEYKKKESMKKIALLTSMGIAAFANAETANEPTNAEIAKSTYLNEVVITGSRIEEKKKDLTTNITTINEDDIKNSTAKDLGELLAEKGIGHIHKYPGSLTSIGIRGFRTETHGNDLAGKVLILINGRRAGTGNVAKILTDNVEKIEIIRGASAVQYGSAGIGGVVNVITKEAKEKPTFTIGSKWGSYDYRENSFSASGKVDKFDFSGSVSKEKMGDYRIGGKGEEYKNTGFDEKTKQNFNIGYEFLPKNRIGLIFNSFNLNEQGSPSYMSNIDLNDFNEKDSKSKDLVLDGALPDDSLSWKFRYFTGEDNDFWHDPIDAGGGWDDGIPSFRKTTQRGGSGQITAKLGNTSLTFGHDRIHYDIESSWDPKKSEYDNKALFVLGKTKFLDDKLIFSYGLRQDEYRVDMRDDGGKQYDRNITKNIGLAYLVTEKFKLRANYAEGFKMPNANELSANYSSWGTNYLGNPNLNPESSQTYEIGFDLEHKGFESSMTYFYTDFKNKIERYDVSVGNRSWKNLGEAVTEGIECQFSYDIGVLADWDFELRPYFGGTFMTKSRDKENEEYLKYVSKRTLSYGIKLIDLDGFNANLNFIYTGRKEIEDWESAGGADAKSKGFSIANLKVSKEIEAFGKYGSLLITGEVNNITNKEYEFVKGYPMPGRNYVVGLAF